MSWKLLLKQTLPNNEIALFSMLSSDSTTSILINLISKKEDKGKRGAGKRKFNALLKKYDDSSPSSLLKSMEKDSQAMFKGNIDEIYENFQNVKGQIAAVFNRPSKEIESFDDYLVEDEELVTYLYKNLRKSRLLPSIKSASPEQLEKMKELFEKYAKKPESYDKFEETLNYNYAKMKIIVLDAPKTKVSGFESEKGPTESATVFKTVFKIDDEEDIHKQYENIVKKLEKELQKGKKSFRLTGENQRVDASISKNTSEFNPRLKKLRGFKFSPNISNKTYSVGEITDQKVKNYFSLLLGKLGTMDIDTNAATTELLIKVGGRKINDATIPIVLKSNKTYRPTDFLYGILTNGGGLEAYRFANRTTVSQLRLDFVPDEKREGRDERVGQFVSLDFTDAIEITDEESEREKYKIPENATITELTEQLEGAIVTALKEYADDDEEIQERLKELNPNYQKGKWFENFVSKETQVDEINVGDSVDALIDLAKSENKSIVSLMDSNLIDPDFSSDEAINLLSLLVVLEEYVTEMDDNLIENLYSPDQQGKEAEANSEAKEAFLNALDVEIQTLNDEFRRNIQNKFQDILDNPIKYKALYKVKPNVVRDSDLTNVLPKNLFEMGFIEVS